MNNISYHGTSVEFAEEIVGPPSRLDISLGRGELGRGFYTGSSIALAAIWAQLKHGEKGSVVEFEIPKQNFVLLKGHLLKTQFDVKSVWSILKLNRNTETFIYGYDYIMAPFATIDAVGFQFKFESRKAEVELKKSTKNIYPCGY